MKSQFSIWFLIFAIFIVGPLHCSARRAAGQSQGFLATKESRRIIVYTEAGEITAVDVSNGRKDFGSYHLEFFTLDTRSLFLPVLLHADMVFYVHTGRGSISWIDKNKVEVLQIEAGDIYRLEEGTVLYIQSKGDPTGEKLRIHAIFNSCGDDEKLISEPFIGGAYSKINDLVRGFDVEILQMGFGVSVEVIEEIKRTEKPPPIIHFKAKNESESHGMDWREGIFEVLGMRTVDVLNEKKKKDKKAFNILKREPDVKNSHGQSIAVTHKDVKSLKGSSMGVFMVNLTKGSMIGPHWNPKATEIAIVIEGHGMVQVIYPSNSSAFGNEKFKTKSLYVKEGDVFVIPKFYPMAQMSFKNSSFVFVGFSNNVKENHPQFLAGKWSVIKAMDREIMATSFNVTSETFGHLLAKQEEFVLLGCEGCAEEVKKKLEEEIERKKEEEDRRKKEKEEADKRREEEMAKRCEEEEARRREEEKRREEEEKERRREEDTRKKEEEEERRREEERKAEEEAEQRRAEEKKAEEEEHRRRKEEEEASKRREEEEEAKRREEEEARIREEEKRKEEEEKERRKEEDTRKKEDEEEKRREEERKTEEEAEKRRAEEKKAEEEEDMRRKEEEEEEKKMEEEKRREEERKTEEEAKQRRAEEEEDRRRKEEEEAAKRKQEDEARKREKKERRREEDAKRKEEEERMREEERKAEEEAEQRRVEEEKTRRREEEREMEKKERREQEEEVRRREEEEKVHKAKKEEDVQRRKKEETEMGVRRES